MAVHQHRASEVVPPPFVTHICPHPLAVFLSRWQGCASASSSCPPVVQSRERPFVRRSYPYSPGSFNVFITKSRIAYHRGCLRPPLRVRHKQSRERRVLFRGLTVYAPLSREQPFVSCLGFFLGSSILQHRLSLHAVAGKLQQLWRAGPRCGKDIFC